MDLSDIQVDDEVFIKEDIRKSLSNFGSNQYKKKMAGTYQIVHSVPSMEKIRIKRIDNSSFNEHRQFWEFHIDDIEIYSSSKQNINEEYKTPELFDINNLVL